MATQITFTMRGEDADMTEETAREIIESAISNAPEKARITVGAGGADMVFYVEPEVEVTTTEERRTRI